MIDWIANIMFNFGMLGIFVCTLIMLVGLMLGGRVA